MVKIFETPETLELAMMDGLHEEQQLGRSSGICNWHRKSTVATAERVPDCGEPHPASAACRLGCACQTCRDAVGLWNRSPGVLCATTTQSESERIRRALGTIRQTRMPFKNHPLRGGLAAARSDRVRGALPRGAQSPRQRQRPTVPFDSDTAGNAGCGGSTPAASRRAAKLILPRCMSTLTIRRPV